MRSATILLHVPIAEENGDPRLISDTGGQTTTASLVNVRLGPLVSILARGNSLRLALIRMD